MTIQQNSMLLSGGVVATVAPEVSHEQNSLRFRNSAGAAVTRFIYTPSSSYRKGVISVCCKRASLGTPNRQHVYQSARNEAPYSNFSIGFNTDDSLVVNFSYQNGVGGGWTDIFNIVTNGLFRDTSAWLHIYFAWDTTDPYATDRGRLFINGKRVRNLSQNVQPALNTLVPIDAVGNTNMLGDTPGKGVFTQGTSFDGYLSEYDRIDGWTPDVTEFGYFDANGFWRVKPFIKESNETTEDPYFSNVVLLTSTRVANGQSSIVDKSLNVKTLTLNGTVSVVQSTYADGSISVYDDTGLQFIGTPGQAPILSAGYSPDFDLGTTYTIEMWVKPYTLSQSFGLVN